MVDSLRILGIDPGSRKTGYGLIEHSGNRTRHLASGFIRLNANDSLADRLLMLSNELGKLIGEFQPDCGAVEKIFYAKNAQSALTLGHARGVILLKFSEQPQTSLVVAHKAQKAISVIMDTHFSSRLTQTL